MICREKEHASVLSERLDGMFPLHEPFSLETLCVSDHVPSRFAGKTRCSRLVWDGRRRTAVSRFAFFKSKTLWVQVHVGLSPV